MPQTEKLKVEALSLFNPSLDYKQLVFVPEILGARNSVNIMQIRERNEEEMGRGSQACAFRSSGLRRSLLATQ